VFDGVADEAVCEGDSAEEQAEGRALLAVGERTVVLAGGCAGD
jgi:hypothetical protein